MGSIRQANIKNFCAEFYKMYPNEVTDDFETNKENIQRICPELRERKLLRNRAAGYLVKIKGKEGRMIFSPKKGKQERKRKKPQRGGRDYIE